MNYVYILLERIKNIYDTGYSVKVIGVYKNELDANKNLIPGRYIEGPFKVQDLSKKELVHDFKKSSINSNNENRCYSSHCF